MAITIQYTDEGEEKIIGSDGKVSENITIQWRQNGIDADVLKRIRREPRVFTKSKINPQQAEQDTENYTGTIDVNGSTLFTNENDTSLLSFTITDPTGSSYPVKDTQLTWRINGTRVQLKDNVYEITPENLIDREVNIITAEYEDEKIRVSDDITILKYIGYDSSSLGDDGDDPTENPDIFGGVLKDSPLIDAVAPNGFRAGRKIRFYWRGENAPFIVWNTGGKNELKQETHEWTPETAGIYTIRAHSLSAFGGEGTGGEETIKII